MTESNPSGGRAVCQTPRCADAGQRTDAQPSSKSTRLVSLLAAAREAAEVVGVSERLFHMLRNESWMPRPVELRPGMPRWVRAELEEAILKRAPRQAAAKPEPAHLAEGRAKARAAEQAAEGGA